MRRRRLVMLVGSVLLGAVLIWFVIRLGQVDLHAMLRQLRHLRLVDFLELVLLNALVIQISTMRWRSIDAVLRRPADAIPSRVAAFCVTSMGMAIGMILPVQLGMTAARTAGIHPYGRTLKRGTGGTLFEQSFDLLVVVLLGFASVLTWVLGGGAAMWTTSALTALGAGLLGMTPALRLFRRGVSWGAMTANRRLNHRVSQRPEGLVARVVQGLSEIEHSGLVNAQLGRRLLVLSAARVAVLAIMAIQTAAMASAHIALWRMAAAVPFSTLANLVALTPGAVGVNELTLAAALHQFGVPLGVASRWVLANRILFTASCFSMALCAMTAFGVERALGLSAVSMSRAEEASVEDGSVQRR